MPRPRRRAGSRTVTCRALCPWRTALTPASGQKVVVVVAREADWEAAARKATLVYAGTEKSLDATWWGKKVN